MTLYKKYFTITINPKNVYIIKTIFKETPMKIEKEINRRVKNEKNIFSSHLLFILPAIIFILGLTKGAVKG